MTETIANTEAYDPYPRDWGHVPLEALVIEGGLVRGPFGGSLTKASFTKQGYKVYEQRNAIYRSTELGRYYIGSAKFKELERFQVSPGEMIVSCSGTIGQIFKLPENSPKGVINQALLKIRLDPERIHDDYFLHVFRSDEFQQRIKENTHGGAMQNLVGMPIFRQTTIACPPTIQEQRAIAEALGDVDELIGSLERLIAKKRDIKKAVMQQLLTGKTRLPGFTGDWKLQRLGGVGRCLRGVSYRGDSDLFVSDTPQTKRLLRSNNVQESTVTTKNVQYVNAIRVSAEQILKVNDVLICMANGSKALVGKAGRFVKADGFDYTFGAFMGCFRTDHQMADSGFIFYLFLTSRYRDYINLLLAGSSINNLRPSNIESLEFPMPGLDEQAAIASVLKDFDSEIIALEERLSKNRDIKQGMMQQLLTGKVRLV